MHLFQLIVTMLIAHCPLCTTRWLLYSGLYDYTYSVFCVCRLGCRFTNSDRTWFEVSISVSALRAKKPNAGPRSRGRDCRIWYRSTRGCCWRSGFCRCWKRSVDILGKLFLGCSGLSVGPLVERLGFKFPLLPNFGPRIMPHLRPIDLYSNVLVERSLSWPPFLTCQD